MLFLKTTVRQSELFVGQRSNTEFIFENCKVPSILFDCAVMFRNERRDLISREKSIDHSTILTVVWIWKELESIIQKKKTRLFVFLFVNNKEIIHLVRFHVFLFIEELKKFWIVAFSYASIIRSDLIGAWDFSTWLATSLVPKDLLKSKASKSRKTASPRIRERECAFNFFQDNISHKANSNEAFIDIFQGSLIRKTLLWCFSYRELCSDCQCVTLIFLPRRIFERNV